MTVSETKLLPCPFCGSDPVCNGHPSGVMGQIRCISADCFGPRTTAAYKEDSIKQWNTRALTAALSDQVVVPKDEDAHVWHMKPTTIPDEMFKRPMFVADALRKMVANCVSLHPAGSSLYTDGERKAMLAAAEHIETFVSVAPPPSSTAGEGK